MSRYSPKYGPGSELTDQEVSAIWKRFVKTRQTEDRDILIEHYMPLVYQTAHRLSNKLPSHVDVEDLMGAGWLGLIDAINRFDPSVGVKFSTYCSSRIPGAILDELRRLDWAPRLVRTRVNMLERCKDELECKLGRKPNDEEIARHMKLSREEYEALCRETQVKSMVSLDRKFDEDDDHEMGAVETMADMRTVDPLTELTRQELKDIAIRGLSDKEKQVMVMYYFDNLSLKEIGAVLDLSESRVCQIHAQTMEFLREKFRQREIIPTE